MSDKLFRRLLVAITILGCLSAIILALVTVCLYRDASIISFIANGR